MNGGRCEVSAQSTHPYVHVTVHYLASLPDPYPVKSSTPITLPFEMEPPWRNKWPEIQEEWKRMPGDNQLSPTAREKLWRLSEELTEARERRELASALEAGFSSYKEYEEAILEEDREREERFRQRVEEETGKTWEEYWATHPQRQKTPPEPFPQCDCEGT